MALTSSSEAAPNSFYANEDSFEGQDYYELFAAQNYTVSLNNTALQASDNSSRHLGIFSVSNLAKWLDRKRLPLKPQSPIHFP